MRRMGSPGRCHSKISVWQLQNQSEQVSRKLTHPSRKFPPHASLGSPKRDKLPHEHDKLPHEHDKLPHEPDKLPLKGGLCRLSPSNSRQSNRHYSRSEAANLKLGNLAR